jgi:hypothetical protein
LFIFSYIYAHLFQIKFMYYQDIPFLIVSKDVATAERIASLLKRKSNTQLECYDPDQIWRFQDSINYFTCSVLHYTEEDHLLIEIIDKSLKRHPVSPVYPDGNYRYPYL